MIKVFHNPRCTKSRDCLLFLNESGAEYEVVKYLETPPTVLELTEIIFKLGIKPIELVRVKEPVWIEKYKNKKLSDKQLIQAMVANPILIERPIVVNGDKAIIARPLEKAASII
jgi:arsenate reductase